MSTATEMRALYIEAEKAVLKGKSISVNGRTMTHENLQEIRAGYRYWDQKVQNEAAGSGRGSSLYSVADFT
jgi:hypothetical protein